MARRKNRRLAGFGLSKAEHQYYATTEARAARTAMQRVRKALTQGNCSSAITWLADAGLYVGKARSHSQSRHKIIKYRKRGGRGSSGGSSVSALWSLAGRVANACAKERR